MPWCSADSATSISASACCCSMVGVSAEASSNPVSARTCLPTFGPARRYSVSRAAASALPHQSAGSGSSRARMITCRLRLDTRAARGSCGASRSPVLRRSDRPDASRGRSLHVLAVPTRPTASSRSSSRAWRPASARELRVRELPTRERLGQPRQRPQARATRTRSRARTPIEGHAPGRHAAHERNPCSSHRGRRTRG